MTFKTFSWGRDTYLRKGGGGIDNEGIREGNRVGLSVLTARKEELMGGFGYWDLSIAGGRLLRENPICWFLISLLVFNCCMK